MSEIKTVSVICNKKRERNSVVKSLQNLVTWDGNLSSNHNMIMAREKMMKHATFLFIQFIHF